MVLRLDLGQRVQAQFRPRKEFFEHRFLSTYRRHFATLKHTIKTETLCVLHENLISILWNQMFTQRSSTPPPLRPIPGVYVA